ncbi:MAG: G5 domain-containing protein, partial [Finegoldia magna]|nr:G5 domain-containing protein [Finegoldia magna]
MKNKGNENKKPFIPLSNETLAKIIFGASIIVGGAGLIGNPNPTYADKPVGIIENIDNESLSESTESVNVNLENDKQITSKADNNQAGSNGKEQLSAESVGKVTNPNEKIIDGVEDVSETAIQGNNTTENTPNSTNHLNDSPSTSREEPLDSNKKITTFSNDTSGNGNSDQNISEEVSQGAELADTESQDTPKNITTYEVKESNAPNYKEDEANIKKYTGNDLGETGQFSSDAQSGEAESLKYEIIEPSISSDNKKSFGFYVEVGPDRDRTFVDLLILGSNNNAPVTLGEYDLSTEDEEFLKSQGYEVNYTDGTVSIARSGRNPKTLTFAAEEKLINYINTHENTKLGFVGKYTKDNDQKSTQIFSPPTTSFVINPYPNENDKFKVIKLNGSEATDPIAAKGQLIKTGAHIDNLDDNALERLVSQTYDSEGNVISEDYLKAEVVSASNIEGLKKELGEEGSDIEVGDVLYRMPKSYYEDGSMFKEAIYKGLKALDVRFYVRPRSAEEFQGVVELTPNAVYSYVAPSSDAPEDAGKYGEETIKQGDKDVTISKQGIARYDHYNSVGNLVINLDDTQYYDQVFKDEKGNSLSNTEEFYPIKPNQSVEVAIRDKSGVYGKDADDMNKAQADGLSNGVINTKDAKANGWKIELTKGDKSKFKVTPPATAMPGDKIAVPVTYTYTNGSTDVHWFHFEIPETDNNLPSYDVKVDYPSNQMTSPVTVGQDEEKNKPNKYTIEDTTYKDDKGNTWTVSINETTGEVTATPSPDGTYNGGEKLTVPVTVKYENTTETETTNAEFVLKEKTNLPPDFDARAGKTGDKLSSTPKVNTKDTYNRKPASYSFENGETTTTVTDDKGNTWNVAINPETGEVTATVPKAAEGKTLEGAVLDVPVVANYKNTDGTSAGTEKANVQFLGMEGEKPLAAPQYDAKVVKAGESQAAPVDTGNDQTATKPTRYSIPEGTTYTDSKGNTWDVSIDEKTGEVTATAPKSANGETLNLDGAILNVPVTAHYQDAEGNEITTKKAAVQFIGSGTNGTHEYTEELPFETTVEVAEDLAPGEWRYKVVDGKEQKGEVGSKTTKWTIKDSKVQENPEVTEKAPVNAIIEIGDKAFTGPVTHEVTEEIPFDVKIVEDENMAPGTSKIVTEGVAGSKTTKYTQNIKDGKPDGELKAEEVTDKKVEPVTQVIHVGKKPTSNTDNKTSEIPVEIEYIYDNTKEDGYVAKGELIPGKVETKVENKYNPETGEIETITTPVVTPAKQKIIVGTKDYTGDFTHTETAEVPFETEIVFDDSLKAGEKQITQEGVPGEKTREVTQSITNGTLGEKTVGEFTETKAPVKQIIKVGSMTDGTVEHTEEIPFGYTINEVDTLKKGEYEVVTPGTVGTKTTKWNIENSKVVGDPKVETTDPVNAVINVGKGTNNGTHEITETEVVPFETVVEFDDSLAPGEQKVTQEGVNGEKQRTTTLTIKDGNVTNTETGEYTETTAPTNKIIKVGRNTDGTVSHEEEIPFKYEIEYDPELESGKYVVDKEGSVGTKKTTWTIENSKVVGDPTVDTTDPVNAKIRVGSKDYTGTFETKKTSPVEFETEYVVDNSLEPGTTVVEQEGSLGEETTTVTHKIENGEVVESTEGETTQTKAPTK